VQAAHARRVERIGLSRDAFSFEATPRGFLIGA
jgi:hypothetical protein